MADLYNPMDSEMPEDEEELQRRLLQSVYQPQGEGSGNVPFSQAAPSSNEVIPSRIPTAPTATEPIQPGAREQLISQLGEPPITKPQIGWKRGILGTLAAAGLGAIGAGPEAERAAASRIYYGPEYAKEVRDRASLLGMFGEQAKQEDLLQKSRIEAAPTVAKAGIEGEVGGKLGVFNEMYNPVSGGMRAEQATVAGQPIEPIGYAGANAKPMEVTLADGSHSMANFHPDSGKYFDLTGRDITQSVKSEYKESTSRPEANIESAIEGVIGPRPPDTASPEAKAAWGKAYLTEKTKLATDPRVAGYAALAASRPVIVFNSRGVPIYKTAGSAEKGGAPAATATMGPQMAGILGGLQDIDYNVAQLKSTINTGVLDRMSPATKTKALFLFQQPQERWSELLASGIYNDIPPEVQDLVANLATLRAAIPTTRKLLGNAPMRTQQQYDAFVNEVPTVPELLAGGNVAKIKLANYERAYNALKGPLQQYLQNIGTMPANGARLGGMNVPPPAGNTPPIERLKEGVHTTFANGQTWTLQNGKAAQIK